MNQVWTEKSKKQYSHCLWVAYTTLNNLREKMHAGDYSMAVFDRSFKYSVHNHTLWNNKLTHRKNSKALVDFLWILREAMLRQGYHVTFTKIIQEKYYVIKETGDNVYWIQNLQNKNIRTQEQCLQ